MTDGRQSWGTTIFCDDVRAEIGGKITLVGVYPSDMLVHGSFPLTMPKFCLWVKYFEIPDTQSGDGKLFVWLPGDDKASIEIDIPMEQMRSELPLHPGTYDHEMDRWLQLQAPLVITPLVLKEPGTIKVRLKLGETEVRLGVLQVKSAPAQT